MTEHHLTLQFQDYQARLVLGGEHSLYDLAEFLLKTLGFDFDHAFEFCDNLKKPYRSKERYTLFADQGDDPENDDPGVNNRMVSAVFRPKRKMVFHFDYGDDWFFLVTCTGREGVRGEAGVHKSAFHAGDTAGAVSRLRGRRCVMDEPTPSFPAKKA